MSPPDVDDGYAISYKVLERGTPVVERDGGEIGTVREVHAAPPAPPRFSANVKGGRLSRFLGGGWKRD